MLRLNAYFRAEQKFEEFQRFLDGVAVMNFVRIGGKRIYALPLSSLVQCDGSYSARQLSAAAAYLITDPAGTTLMGKRIDLVAISATEAEWASVYHGLEAAMELDQESIKIENDCLSIVAGLVHPTNPLKHVYARHYRKKIQELAAGSAWTGIRWIPRKLNKADALFRLK
jgi:ribonuclease HI